MSQPSTIWEQLRWDVLALFVVALLAVGYAAIQDPRLQPAESPQADGSKPPDRSEGDVLLVVPTAPPARAVDFDTLDCTFSWFNALWQYFGTFAMAPADTITPQLLAGHSVVVLPGRVAAAMGSGERNYLEEFARQGGQLVIEAPRGDWEPITGLSTVGAISRAESISSAEGLDAERLHGEYLLDVPLSGRLLPAADLAPQPDGPVVFEIGEQPAMIVEPLERGHVYSLLFDFGCSLLAMHQGKPTRELEFGTPESERWLPTADRVASEKLLATTIPYGEVLQRAVFDRIPEKRPMARLWPYPGAYRGAAMTVHPAERSPRAAFGYADWARKKDASSTIFAAPDYFTSNHAALAAESGADVGLLWVLGRQRSPVTEGVGFGAIRPWKRELSLPRQQLGLEAALGDRQSVSKVRTEGALWEADWDSTFRTLAGAGVRIDNSFGPADSSQYGFLFGTGMPFYPLDDRGRPLPVLEMPFVLDGASITTDRLRELLDASRRGFHQPIVVSLSSDAMEREPSAGILLGFRDFHRLSREYDHWLTTIADYVDFLTARRHSIVTSQWSADEGRLTVSVNLMGARLGTAPDGAIPSVAVPEHYQGRGIDRIEVDDDEVDLEASSQSGDGDERIVVLPAGRHVLSVFYEPPPESDDEDDD